MKKCDNHEVIERKNSDDCVMFEFPMKDDDVNFAIATLSARYPSTGLATNLISKELVYVQEGSGKIVINNVAHDLKKGDVILIDPAEKFYWDGNMTLHIACTPAFKKEQHVYIAE